MPHHHHHHHRHDVYDDTTNNQELFDPGNEVTVHRHDSDRSGRRHRRRSDHHESNALIADPFRDMDDMWRAAERDMDRTFGGFGGFGGGMFGSMRNMMTSMDRMFDEVRAHAGPGSGGNYFYESRKMTVGPDGHVHEETVRTVPDEHGNPQTSRTVRNDDRVEEMSPYRGRIGNAPSSQHYDNDVIIEEVDENGHPIDENGNPIYENRGARRISRDWERRQDDRGRTTGGWLRNKYREWRSN